MQSLQLMNVCDINASVFHVASCGHFNNVPLAIQFCGGLRDMLRPCEDLSCGSNYLRIRKEEWGKLKQIQGNLKILTGKAKCSIIRDDDDSDSDFDDDFDVRKE